MLILSFANARNVHVMPRGGKCLLFPTVGATGKPPTIPSAYPPLDETVMITGSFLKAPIVADALAIVQATVPASLLNIQPSTYIQFSEVTYHADPASTCYWPNNLCIRKTDGNGYVADVYTCPGSQQWGLTYDDGPTVNLVNGVHVSDTSEIRANLDSMGLKATFFTVGVNIAGNPGEIAKHVASGHQVAVHTWTHHPLTSLTNEQIVAEIKYSEAIIYQQIGKVSGFLRPPYGDVDDRVRAIANALGYRIVLWDRDSTDSDQADTSSASASSVLSIIESWFSNKNSFVALEHDISTFTSGIAVKALKAVQGQGSSFALKIMPVATCNNLPWYTYENSVSTITTTKTTTAITTSSPSALPISPDGTCGASGYKCDVGICCSQFGFCGITVDHCGTGCQTAFGVCGVSTTTTTTKATTTISTTTTSSTSVFSSISPSPSTLPISPDSVCGNGYRCDVGVCCSQYGFCGTTTAHCGVGCQSAFGFCGILSSTTTVSTASTKASTTTTASTKASTTTTASTKASTTTTVSTKASTTTITTTSSAASPSSTLLGDWQFCSANGQCANNCCSNQYSDDGKYKCTPGGTICVNSVTSLSQTTTKTVSVTPSSSPTAALLGDWAFCATSTQCTNKCCSSQYSNDGMLKCTPGGTVCVNVANLSAKVLGATTSPTPVQLLANWVKCTSSKLCSSKCCSKQYSNDGLLKCTPGGSVCVA
ncbi:chitin deacetylase [Nowakowskiella sp. JEL0078]|nr:chitin deacetylase [Nowakowskiella sp. JEL0078]